MGRRRRFSEAAARRLLDACPPEARFLLWSFNNTEGKNKNNASKVCPHCFQVFLPGNFRVRLNPKMKVTPQIQRLLNLEGKNYKLNLKQTKLLKKYKHSKNVLLITCNVCRKTTRHYGKSREYSHIKGSTLKSSTFSNKTMPSSLSGTKRRESSSNFRIATSGQSTPCSSSRTSKNAKLHFAQLKRLLILEENKKSDKGDLKNFLSSL
ncbi:UPF0711 protein C18orf21 homolog [Tiliqua scincoides]|uniref:UPF0711 protein C18orf21 homolog n=1 Tax=Tiliqua scincoides TaxID=71010 RepID=UPI003462F9F9